MLQITSHIITLSSQQRLKTGGKPAMQPYEKSVSYVGMTESRLSTLITGCRNREAASQKALFLEMYDFGMSIARRYGKGDQDAEEIANDAFFKMLKNIDKYQEHIPFKLWLRRIIINTGIDHYRKNKRHNSDDAKPPMPQVSNQGEANLDKEYLIELLNRLTPQYKLVFVLFAIEGYSHEEIANQLGITIGTSKSNLSKARRNLKMMLAKIEENEKF